MQPITDKSNINNIPAKKYSLHSCSLSEEMGKSYFIALFMMFEMEIKTNEKTVTGTLGEIQ